MKLLAAVFFSSYFLYDISQGMGENIYHDFPPTYWINLDISVSRREAMLDSFLSLGISGIQTRISAFDNSTAYRFWMSSRLIFHPKIRLEAKAAQQPSLVKHINNVYHYEEAACLLSHFSAIEAAYEAGHEAVLILEDDALLSVRFVDEWLTYSTRAPFGWKILQFATTMPVVLRQGVSMEDPFISWQPYHWSTRAYMINRAGMETLIDKVFSTSLNGEGVWSIVDSPLVVSDEAIYAVVGDVYTSTGLCVDSLNFKSTVQSETEMSATIHLNISSIVNNWTGNKIYEVAEQPEFSEDSLLVLMSVRISTDGDIVHEVRRIQQDCHAVCQFHRKCDWKINAVVAHRELMANFQQMALFELPSNIHVVFTISSKLFNKFVFLQESIDDILNYDLLLLKDSDQRISGFPWKTFIKKKGNATVSGPLRQNADEAFLHSSLERKHQYFQFHQALEWFHYTWSSNLVADILPTEVPLVEMFFTLFDAKFAHYFFQLILTPEFVQQESSWGPDYLWCQAAREWNSKRIGCHLVPLVSSHEDTRQMLKDKAFYDQGSSSLHYFDNHQYFQKWMKISKEWARFIGDKNLYQIEQGCRQLLGSGKADPFCLQKCISKNFLIDIRSSLE